MRCSFTDVRVELIPSRHCLHFECTHRPSLVSLLIIGRVKSTTDAAKRAWVPFERHLLDMELTKVDLTFWSDQRLTLFLERISDSDHRLLLLKAITRNGNGNDV